MNVYLAARYDRRNEMAGYAMELEQRGHKVSSRWVSREYAEVAEYDPVNFGAYALGDLEDIRHSDVVVSFLESEQKYNSGGRHVELGYALGLGIPAITVGQPENVFHHLSTVYRCAEWSNALVMLDFARMAIKKERADGADSGVLKQVESFLVEHNDVTVQCGVHKDKEGFSCSFGGNVHFCGDTLCEVIEATLYDAKINHRYDVRPDFDDEDMRSEYSDKPVLSRMW